MKSVAVLGLGASGRAAARLALLKGATVHVSDLRTDADAAAHAATLRELGAHVELGTHDLARIAQAGVVVVSPGIPPDAPVLRALRERGTAWISEPEFAARFYQGPLIAVTGTNGKTTTAALAAHLMKAAGIDAALGGNVGEGLAPAASELALREPPPAWYVLEVSSFQLAETRDFAPDIGVVTTLAPDHLDRYPNTEAYYADKARLFRNGTAESRWILNGEVAAVRALPGNAPGTRYYFARDAGTVTDGAVPAAFVRDGALVLRVPPGEGVEEPLLPAADLPILGDHNVMNALAASLAARLAGASPEGIRTGLGSFRGLPHRMTVVAERGGILWIDDSKATNVEAARSAVEGSGRPLVVLLGGKDKGEDFRPLAPALEGRARLAVLYGEAAPRLEAELRESGGDRIPLVRVAEGFDRAVEAAEAAARPGDILLLSPACSSFDLFRDYRARGERFAELARGGRPA
jgi:UDP-N-acetylmuramoylalanine--D-glutamate ligase